MSGQASDLSACYLGRVTSILATFTVVFSATNIAWPQQLPPTQQQLAPVEQTMTPAKNPAQPQSPPATEVPANSNPGLVEEIGRLLNDSVTGLKDSAAGLTSRLPSARETIDGINNSAKDATDSLSRISPLSAQTMVTGRTGCPAAGNGAPDCKAASDKLCRDKGYREGKSIDIETSEKCSARVYLSGRTGAPGECRTENFVTRAVCQ